MGSSTQGQQSSVQLVLQDTNIQAQELPTPVHRKTTRYLSMENWLKWDLIKKLHRKKKTSKR